MKSNREHRSIREAANISILAICVLTLGCLPKPVSAQMYSGSALEKAQVATIRGIFSEPECNTCSSLIAKVDDKKTVDGVQDFFNAGAIEVSVLPGKHVLTILRTESSRNGKQDISFEAQAGENYQVDVIIQGFERAFVIRNIKTGQLVKSSYFTLSNAIN